MLAPPQGIIGMSGDLYGSYNKGVWGEPAPGIQQLETRNAARCPRNVQDAPPTTHTHTYRGRDYPAAENEKPRSSTCRFIPFRASLSISKESLCVTSFQNACIVILPSGCRVRSDPVTPQPPTLRGSRCAWQKYKLLPVATEALLDVPCWS